MGATLSTLRKYIRAEVNDPAPTRVTTTSITHDDGSQTTHMEDSSVNFVTEGVSVGDVIYNVTDGGSLAVIRAIGDGDGTNDRLYVSSIEGGTGNTYEDGDVCYIYDRHAQRGLDGTRWIDSEVEDALAQAQKIVALRFGGVEKFNIHQDIKVMSKINLTVPSGTFVVGETVDGGTNAHSAVIEYVGDDFIVVSTMRTTITIDTVSGTFEPNETLTGATNSYTCRLISTNGSTTVVVEVPTGEYDDDEVLTGATSAATCAVNEATSYSSGLFVAGETLTGATSSATANVKATYAANNICVGQDMPTDLKHLLIAKWWDGSHWRPLIRDDIFEYTSIHRSTGNPTRAAVFGTIQVASDATPQKKLWLWASESTKQYNELHLFYMAWDRSLSSDTDTTDFDNRVERLVVLEGARILAGQVNEDALFQRIMTDIELVNRDIDSSGDNETDEVRQVIHWNYGFDDEGAFIP